MKKNLVASLAVASTIGFLAPLTGYAFGLGQLELKSALNQPFKAEVSVNALDPGQRELLEVSLASSDEFEKAGLDRPFLLTKFKFEIIEDNNQTKILITSKDAVKEPFLDFLLTATTGQGRLLREYTVLLDPPEFVMQETGILPPPTVTETSDTKTVTTESNITTYQYTQPAYNSNTYAVKRTDTLWNIALKTRPSKDVSVHKMMLALVEKNPSAFTNQNINGLQAGRTLQIPSTELINARTHAQAIAEVKQQNIAWQNRNKPVSSPAPVVTSEMEAEATTETDVEADQTTVSTTDNEIIDGESKLNLVAPEDLETSNQDASTSTMGSSEVKELAEQLTLAQETIEAQTQENIDFQQRMAALEEQVDTLRRMISIKDADLARLQEILEEDNTAVSAETQQEQTGSEDSNSSADSTAEEQTLVEDTEETQNENMAETSTAAETEQADFISSAAESLNIAPEEVQSIIEQVKQFVMEHKLETGLGALLILLLLWLVARRRNKEVTWNEAMAEVEPDLTTDVTDAPLQDNAEQVEVDEEQFEESAPAGKSASELIEQADMFIGYADYIQAQTSLTQAHLQEPENIHATSKLLFVLYKQQQTQAFLDVIAESNIDKTSPEWAEICTWGRELLPDDALFLGESEEEQSAATDMDMDSDDTTEAVVVSSDIKEDDALAFNLDDFASEDIDETGRSNEVQEPVSIQPEVLSFDLDEQVKADEPMHLDSLDLDEAEAVSIDETAGLSDIEPLELDIEGLSETSEVESSDETVALDLGAELDSEHDDLASFTIDTGDNESLDELEFELPEQDFEEFEELDLGENEIHDLDEAETKLDLAAAYIDMDDPEGATNILNEVLAEGNEEQQKRAQELLDSLS